MHNIFKKPFTYWWFTLAVLCFIIYYSFGIPETEEFRGRSYIYAIIATLFSGLVFGSLIYLLYRLLFKKWDNKVYMIIISITCIIVLLLPFINESKKQVKFEELVEFPNYTNVEIKIDDNNYYHSKLNNYRVQIPENWSLFKGAALGVEFNATNEDESAIFTMTVANLNGNNITVDDIPDSFMINLFKSDRVKEMNILKVDETTLANQKVKHHNFSFKYDHLGEEKGFFVNSYMLMKDNKSYFLVFKERIGFENTHSTEFNNILSSFMLEHYK